MARLFRILRKLLGALVLCFFFSIFSTSSVQAGKAGINIGDHFGEVDQAAAVVGDDGWIVVMAQPGDCMALSEMIKDHPTINFVIRGHHPSTAVMSPDHAKAWAYTLANMDTGGNRIYFYPVNEPFTSPDEGFSRDPDTTAAMVNAYVDTLLSTVPGLENKVTFLSPMINRSHGDFENNLARLGGADFFRKFDAVTMNLYDLQHGCGSTFCNGDPDANAREFHNTLEKMGVSDMDIYAVESGVWPNGAPRVLYRDQELVPLYKAGYEGGPFNDGQLKMTAVFSYDPHGPGEWSIYGSQTAAFFSSGNAGSGTPVEKYEWDGEREQQEEIARMVENGQLAKCDECGVSPVTASGEKFCQGTGKYDLEIFPDYEFDQKDYYLYPICVDGENCRTGDTTKDLIAYKKSLIEQGYEAHCAENEVNIAGNYSGDWGRYLALIDPAVQMAFDALPDPDGYITKEFPSTQVIDYTNLKVPVFRDQSGKRWRMTSIEEFFGFKDIYSGEDTTALVNSAPIEKLLSEEQRCQLSVEVLKDARSLCETESRDISECALNTLIPDPSNEFGELKRFDVLRNYEQAHMTCAEIVRSNSSLKRSISQVPLYLERAYRVGFLVTTIRHLSPGTSNEFFNFLSERYNNDYGKRYGSKFTETSIIAFKIPDVGLSHHKDLQYNDPLQLTRDTVLSTKQQETQQATQSANQKYYKHNSFTEYVSQSGNIEGGQRWMGGNSVINCPLTPGCSDLAEGGVDPLFKALIDMINAEQGINEGGKIVPGYAYTHTTESDPDYEPPNTRGAYLSCKPTRVKITPEKVEVIGDSANIANTDNLPPIKDDLGHIAADNITMLQAMINKLRTTDTNVTRSNLPNFITQFMKTQQNTDTRVVELNTYLVYPGDYEIGTVADAIRSPFVPFEIAKQADENRRDGCDTYDKDCDAEGPKRSLRLSAIMGQMIFNGGKIAHSFVDGLSGPNGTACDVYETTPNPNDDCEIRDFLLSVVGDPQKVMAYPGEKVAFWLRETQKFLSPATSNHNKYLASCATVEQFLLGTCGGGSSSSPGQSFPVPPIEDGETWLPPEDVWSAIMAASQRHGCDPYMMAAVAWTESFDEGIRYNPNAYNEGSGATGLFQYMPGSWDLWWGRGTHQPGTFDPTHPEFNPRERTNIYAAADAACRHLLWLGLQKYPPDEGDTQASSFIRAFAIAGDNPSCQIWNRHTGQAGQVYAIWKDFLARTNSSPVAQPANYPPPPLCPRI